MITNNFIFIEFFKIRLQKLYLYITFQNNATSKYLYKTIQNKVTNNFMNIELFKIRLQNNYMVEN